MATPVSRDLVTRVWQEMNALSIDEVHVLIEQMQAEQPALMAYLLALDGYGLPREELEVVFYLGIGVWQMMKRGHPRLISVPIEQLEKAEEENAKTLRRTNQEIVSLIAPNRRLRPPQPLRRWHNEL